MPAAPKKSGRTRENPICPGTRFHPKSATKKVAAPAPHPGVSSGSSDMVG